MSITTEKLYIISTNLHSFRPNVPALITGFKMVKPNEHLEKRQCFEVTYEDGFVDYIAADDHSNFIITTMNGIIAYAKQGKL